MTSGFLAYSARIRHLAQRHPDRHAVVAVRVDGTDEPMTWHELDYRSTRLAHLLHDRGLEQGSWLVVGLPNGVDHVVSCVAGWKLGACVLPLSPRAPAPERDAHLELADPAVVIGDWPDVDAVRSAELGAEGYDVVPLLDTIASPGKAIGTGGSTGRPKLIVQDGPWGYDASVQGMLQSFGLWTEGSVQLLAGPLHHNFGFDWCFQGLMAGQTIVLLERFDAERAVSAIERHRVEESGLVPTMMRRIAQLPGIQDRDLSSLRAILHSAGPCPAWVKEAWIKLIGGDAVIEGYGASEGYGNAVITGTEWLAHRGSVGRPLLCEMKILDEDGEEVPAGVVGEVFMRRTGQPPNYVGDAVPRMTPDGFGSVGDLGWVDSDGYLYLADRRVDLIVTGGANVYPAEVESALTEHPAVFDVAVIGLPDDDMGKRVHAIVQLVEGAVDPAHEDLTEFLRQRLASYKVPRTYEFLPQLPRDDGGKIRRIALVAERAGRLGVDTP